MTSKDLKYTIHEEVFTKFPGYARGVVLAHEVSNGPSPDELIALLREAESALMNEVDAEALANHPRIASWRDAYRAFGVKPTKFRPSMEAMARRVLKKQELPSISSLVDIGNIVSLRHLVPAGGHAIDVLTGDIALRMATGEEEFVPFGSDEMEHPAPGEIIFAEGNIVLTRRWTWRQSNHTLMVPSTTAIEFNVDGLPPVEIAEVEETCREIADLIGRFCGGSLSHDILTEDKPTMSLT